MELKDMSNAELIEAMTDAMLCGEWTQAASIAKMIAAICEANVK